MFDRVWLYCLKCGGPLEAQSKAGDRTLADYNVTDVPPCVAGDIDGDDLHCEQCGEQWTVQTQVIVQLVPFWHHPKHRAESDSDDDY